MGLFEDQPVTNFGLQPIVDAGENATVEVNSPLQLNGNVIVNHVSDLTIEWRMVSGPGNVVFSNPSAVNPTVQFDQAGSYMLELSATNGVYTAEQSMFVTVTGVPAGNQPALPELFDTTYSLPTGGTTHVVNAGGDFQAALDAAVAGDVIVLEAGATFTGNFTLPKKVGDGWIYIISSELDQLPADGRVGLEHAHLMPKLVAKNDQLPVLISMFGAHHYRLAGIEVSTDQPKTDLIRTGYGIPDGETSLWEIEPADTVEELPHHITFDRMLVHSTSDANRLRIGINLNGQYMAVVNSYIANVKDTADAQAILVWNGDGPYKIVNNFLESTGENVLFGGNDPRITNSVPADIEIRGNHFFKRTEWISPDIWNVKNLLELKNAQRVLISGNVFENNWADAQVGTAILFSPRNQNGGGPWTVVQDVTFENNLIRNVGQAIRITGEDGNHPSEQTKRIRISNNLIENVSSDYGNPRLLWILTPVTGGTGNPGRPVLDLTVTHNTLLYDHSDGHVGNNWLYLESKGQIVVENLVFQNNITAHGDFGPKLEYATNPTISDNVFVFDPNERTYSNFINKFDTIYPGNSKANTIDDVGFVDYANGAYRLAAGSSHKTTASDGTAPGVNIDTLLQAINGVVAGALGLQSQTIEQGFGSATAAGLFAESVDGSYSLMGFHGTSSQLASTSTQTLVKSSDLLLIDYAFDPSLSSDEATNGSGELTASLIEDEDAESSEAALDEMFGSLDEEMEFQGITSFTL